MTDTRQPGLITPDNAPRLADLNDDNAPYPSQITVFCDNCGVEHTADYLVPADATKAGRLGIARAHLRTLGWICNLIGDYCPRCVAAPTRDAIAEYSPILGDVWAERVRQIEKFGEQHREDGADPMTYGPIAARSRENFQNAEANGGATWHRALNGPFFESVSETDPAMLRASLVELAAVACAWIEDIDSRKEVATAE